MTNPQPLDEISRAIIAELRQDGRRPYAAIGKAVGLSETAVRQRVHRLLDSGTVQVVALTDPARVGLNRQAMIGLRSDGDVQALADALAEIPEIVYVVITAGTFDLLAEVVCEDDERLLAVLNDRIRSLPGVLATETFVYLRIRKQAQTHHRG
jgi:Lrp/AsnC family transcriptional regulator for asnA, asnC and gidA